MSERGNLSDRAYEYLRDAIVSGRLVDGSQHSIYGVAEQMEISRTPVREAVLQLASVGLVTIEKNRGFRVCGTSVKKLQDIFQVRLLLEVPAAQYVAGKNEAALAKSIMDAVTSMEVAHAEGDDQRFRDQDKLFHDLIARGAGNQQLSATLDSLRSVVVHSEPNFGVRKSQEIVQEHAMIAAAITRGDAHNASLAMHDHLVSTGNVLLQHLSHKTGEAVDTSWSEILRLEKVFSK